MAAHGCVRTPVAYPTRSRPPPLAQREWGATTPLVIPSGVVEWGGRYPVGSPTSPLGSPRHPSGGSTTPHWGVKPPHWGNQNTPVGCQTTPVGKSKHPSGVFSGPSGAIEPAHWGEATAHWGWSAPPQWARMAPLGGFSGHRSLPRLGEGLDSDEEAAASAASDSPSAHEDAYAR